MPSDASPSPPPHAVPVTPKPHTAAIEPVPTTAWGRAKYYVTHRVDPLTSLFLVLPLYVVYQIGVLAEMECAPDGSCRWVRNGADLITGNVMEATHGSRFAFGMVALGVGLVLGVGILWARRRSKLHPRVFIPVLLESMLYASLVGPAIVAVQRVFPLGAPGAQTFVGDIIASCGAGLHEELIFRAILFSGLAWALSRMGMRGWLSVALAGLVSSVVFSAVHHLGALGEAFTAQAFLFRVCAGLIFATIYRARGFAIAAWTHCLYDVWVFAGQRFFVHG